MKQDLATRLLAERDRERETADRLAVAVDRFLNSKPEKGEKADLANRLMDYCIATGYNGPAGRWAKQIAIYQKTLKDGS